MRSGAPRVVRPRRRGLLNDCHISDAYLGGGKAHPGEMAPARFLPLYELLSDSSD